MTMWFLLVVLILTVFVFYTYKLTFFVVIGLYVTFVFYLGILLARLIDEEEKD